MTDAVIEAPPRLFVPGEYDSMTHDDYLAIDALSSSALKRLMRSAAHMRYGAPIKPTANMVLGTVVHMGVLEPDRFDGGAVIAEPEDSPRRPNSRQVDAAKPSRATLDAMDYWREFDARHAGAIVLAADDYETAQRMVESARSHPLFDDLLGHGASELSMLWRDCALDVACKSRPDKITPDGIVVDVKTTGDASPEGFARIASVYGYHYQEAHYRNGYEHLRDRSPEAFLFFAIERDPPYASAIYHIASNAILFAQDRIDAVMRTYAECMETGYWPGYSARIQQLVLPRWATTINAATFA